MAGRYAENSETRIAELAKEGRGQGIGADYKPWITINDLSSEGRVHRRLSRVSGRVVHLLSDIEEDVFMTFDEHEKTLDIREQFPLPRVETTHIANRLDIRHPVANGVPIVMTTDLLVDLPGRRLALSVKPSSKLGDRRTLEKLEIERVYWRERIVEWYLVTEESVSRDARIGMQERADWGHDRLIEADTSCDWNAVADVMLVEIAGAPRGRINDFCAGVEARNGWAGGAGISAIKLLLARRLIRLVDADRLDPFADERRTLPRA